MQRNFCSKHRILKSHNHVCTNSRSAPDCKPHASRRLATGDQSPPFVTCTGLLERLLTQPRAAFTWIATYDFIRSRGWAPTRDNPIEKNVNLAGSGEFQFAHTTNDGRFWTNSSARKSTGKWTSRMVWIGRFRTCLQSSTFSAMDRPARISVVPNSRSPMCRRLCGIRSMSERVPASGDAGAEWLSIIC
jgi:hypothetical protein